ncbi:hypothetical protein BJY52DRAFT_1254341 [Lactarius psammicola]|nr:hypothetical protein BJY52DRAFT_1254341 [Lactarius psammicola]
MLKETVTKYTSSSSLPSSIALSNFSPQSRRSSWHSKPVCSIPLIPTAGGNGLTMHRSHPGHRPRSLSQPQPLDIPVPAEVGDGGWSDLGEDFIDAYFGGSESFSVPNEDEDENLHDDDVDLPLDIGEDSADPASLFHRYHSAYVDDPDDLSPFPLATAHPAQQPPYPHSPTAATTPTLLGVPPGSQMVTVKTVLDNSIVVFRVRRDVALVELRRRVHEKFARTESIALHGAFALAYFIPTDGNSGRRASSMSGDFSRALPIWDEEDWQDAVTRCGSKITLQVYYPSS